MHRGLAYGTRRNPQTAPNLVVNLWCLLGEKQVFSLDYFIKMVYYLILFNVIHFNIYTTTLSVVSKFYLTLRRLQILYKLQRPSTHTRSSLISSFRSTLSELKRGQQYLGALVAVVRQPSVTYIGPRMTMLF